MSSPSIVAVVSGRGDSHDAVRRAAWLSQHGGLPLTGAHAYHDTATGPARKRMREQHELRERTRAEEWLRNALDESPALPHDLRLVVAEGSPDGRARRAAPVAVGVPA